MSAKSLLLEIIDIKERVKSPYLRDRINNSQGCCLSHSMEFYDAIYYPGQLKGNVMRPEVSFSFYKN